MRRADAATLEAYLLERLDAEYPGDTLEHLAAAYRFFGLIPDTVELRRLLVDLLLEQAIGYYDPARDVLFIREEAPPAMLDALMVHELVHALQDQHVDLDSLVRSTDGNDARTAIQTALEGHATAAMFAYQYAAMTGGSVSPEELPEIGPEMAAAIADPAAFPELARAPAIVKDPLIFAYLGGTRFIQRLWRAQPERPAPLGQWLPESMEQLLHTERLLEERDSPVALELGEPSAGWEMVYARDLGELEIRIYFEEHLGERTVAERAAAGWDGDSYALLSNDGRLGLVWHTAWDSEADAEEFAEAYQVAFHNRFGGGGSASELVGRGRQARVERTTVDGTPVVTVVESEPGAALEPLKFRLARPGR